MLSHRHIGGSANPSPIDLAVEVKNGLSSNNITHIDAAKITSGIIDSARLPKISHTTLEDVGNLTHTELETMLFDVVNQDSTFTLADLSSFTESGPPERIIPLGLKFSIKCELTS